MQYGLINNGIKRLPKEDNLVMSTQEVLMHIESAELFFKVTFIIIFVLAKFSPV